MYLKSLEIVGFKSFADPTVINFDRGVTAIVGPNGCGKSNVLDAIRWVLGEQSAKALRGGNMQDVIFSGTDSRRPLGMAEVSMHFAECEKELGTDYHEVRITRRVFRDGRSEYEINKTPCRLKDIQMLFMDTGIGRSAYSIMEQGKIDKILSAKPDDRREVFEEAAGITKFKAQKKEALRKLEATESNLTRVGDITRELSRQIGSLQRQAGKARRYQEVYGRLRYLDTRLAAQLYTEMKERLDQGQSRVEQLQLEFASIQRELDTRENDLRDKRRRAEELEIEIRSLTQQRSLAESAIEKARQAIAFNEQRVGELQTEQEQARAEIAATSEKIALLEEAVQRARAEAGSMEAELSRIRTDLNARSAEQDAARQQVAQTIKERTRLEQEIARTDKQINDLRQRLAAMELQQRSYIARAEKLEEEEKILAHRGAELEQSLLTARQLLQKSQTEWDEKKREIESLRATVDQATQVLDQARQQADEAAAHLARKESRCAVLAEIIGSRAGYSDVTRELLGQFQGKGVLGTLLDQVEVEPASAKAIQRALGTAWEALIVDSPESIEAIAELLRQKGATAVLADLNAAARLTQPPPAKGGLLQKIALNFFGTKVEDTRASVASPEHAALRFVKPSPAVRPLVERILEEFLVADDATQAAALRQAHPHCHVVTRGGEVWFRNGLQVRGDDASAIAAIIEQESEWKTLKAELPEMQKTAEARRHTVEQARSEMQAAEARLQQARQIAQELEGATVSARFEVQALERQIQEWKTASQTASREKTHLAEQQTKDQSGRGALEAQLHELESQRQQQAQAAETLVSKLGELNSEVERCSQAVADVRVAQAAQQQKAQTIQQELRAAEARLHEVQSLRQRREQEIATAETRITEARQAIERANTEIETARHQLQELAQTLTQRTTERQELNEALTRIEEEARTGRRRAGEVQTVCGREEVQVAEQRLKLDALTERIRRAYEVDLATLDPSTLRPPAPQPTRKKSAAELDVPDLRVDTATETLTETGSTPSAEPSAPGGETGQAASPATEPVRSDSTAEQPPEAPAEDPLLVDPINWDAVAAEVNELRDRIERMGPVNVEAITEYEELEQRLNFLAAQEQDLIKSRDQLHEAIKRINETTRTMFAETFEKIKANFAEMFVELFGGGKAELSLLDSEDPLECGIEIVARPPGKQLQSISLLSGGEKTMTAVALLFAIYMVKPSPFCFLDEMDAPLDESNINRFIRILQRFVKQSQFVVITHNKRTISSADVLYGVTMEQHGISKIVSVRLSRKEESPLFNGRDHDDAPPSIADSIRHGELKTESTVPSPA